MILRILKVFFIFRGCKSFDHPEDILPSLNYSPSIFCNHFSSRELGPTKKRRAFFPRFPPFFFFFPFSLSWHDIESRPNNRGSNEGFSRSKKKSKSQVLSRMDLDLDHAIHSFFGNKPPAHRCPVSHVRELRKKYRGRQTMEGQANEDDISAYNITVESRIS